MTPTALISVNRAGGALAARLAAALPGCACTRYAFHRYAGPGEQPFTSLSALTGELFPRYRALVFLAACGIAVRAVAPHLRHKATDPAVVAVDTGGRFAVPLVSGHLGGANSLARHIAQVLGATPVITTATDAGGAFSPDSFARANHLHILDMGLAKAAAAAVLEGAPLGFASDYPAAHMPAGVFAPQAPLGLSVSVDETRRPVPQTLRLVPQNLLLGVGCKKGVPPGGLRAFILSRLKAAGLPLYRLRALCTIDRKQEEPALLAFCQWARLPLLAYTPRQLMSLSGPFAHSDFVLQTTGADNVCERAAMMQGGRLLLPRQAENGMTLALAELEVALDFERGDL